MARRKKGPKGPGSHTITRDLYDRMVEFFRERPGKMAEAARYFGVSEQMTRKAWHKGWSLMHAGEWAIPIKERLAQEHRNVRAERQGKKEDEGDPTDRFFADSFVQKTEEDVVAERARRSSDWEERQLQAREDAIQASAEEAEMVRIGRRSVMKLLHQATFLAEKAQPLTTAIAEKLESYEVVDPSEATKILNRINSFASESLKAGQLAMRMERLYAGEAEGTFKVEHEMSPEEAAEELQSAAEEANEWSQELEAIEAEFADEGSE